MGIIGRRDSSDGKRAGTTVIAAGTELVGDLTLEDSLHLDGKVQGAIRSTAEVTVGESGHFEGQLSARRVIISGSFDGQLDAERLEIVASGKVTGEISVSQLVVESGAHFNGTSRIKGDEPPRQLGHDKESTATAIEKAGETAESSTNKPRKATETA